MNAYIQSFSGLAVTPFHLEPEQVRFEDIPHALAQKVRFAGHLRDMGYSVAQHCVLGAERIAGPAVGIYARVQLELKLAFLLHEVSEVYLPDIPAPIKPHLRIAKVRGGEQTYDTWEELEDQHAEAMFNALGLSFLLPVLYHDSVKSMDRAMLTTEKRDLRLLETDPVLIEQETKRYKGEPVPGLTITRVWGPAEAKHEFTVLYHHLRKELGL